MKSIQTAKASVTALVTAITSSFAVLLSKPPKPEPQPQPEPLPLPEPPTPVAMRAPDPRPRAAALPVSEAPYPLAATEENATAAFSDGQRCFHCGGNTFWKAGPCGGVAQNLLCGCCGQEINYAFVFTHPNGVINELRDIYEAEGRVLRDRFDDDRGSKYGPTAEAERAQIVWPVPVQ